MANEKAIAGKPEKKRTGVKWVIALEILLLLLMMGKAPEKLQSAYGAEKIAEKYFVHIVNGEYDKAYELLNIEETEFINEASFAGYCESLDLGEVTNYEIEVFSTREQTRGEGTVLIEYWKKGEGASYNFEVDVERADNKNYLFFENWGVKPDSLICYNFYVGLQEDASLLFDGVTISDTYLATGDYYTGEPGAYKAYCIPQLFKGWHSIEITMDYMEPIKQDMNITLDGSSKNYFEMTFSEAGIKELQKLAYENMKKIYTAAEAGKPFEEISDLLTVEAKESSNVQYAYESLCGYFGEGEAASYVAVKAVTAEGDTSSSTVHLEFDYEVDYARRDWFSGKLIEGTHNYNRLLSFTFDLRDGKWLQTNLGCDDFERW